MDDLGLVMRHALAYGLILSALLSLLIGVSAYLNPEIWVGDYPPDIKARYGAISARSQRQKRWVALPFFGLLLGLIALSLIRLRPLLGGTLTFGAAFVDVFLVVFTFNLIDLLVLDWLLFVTIRPRFFILPGTAGMAGYHDYGFHFRGFLIGTAGSVMAALVLAGVVALLELLIG